MGTDRSPGRTLEIKVKKVSVSLLGSDYARLADELVLVTQSGADLLHLDIMDGHFVNNLSFGPSILPFIRKHTHLPIDVHLMVSDPGSWVAPFLTVKDVRSITFHLEATDQVPLVLQSIRAKGVLSGLALKPATPPERLFPFLQELDIILVMTVEPGLGGQNFLYHQISKLDKIKAHVLETGQHKEVQVDGGVNDQNAHVLQSADVLISGSFIFKNKGYYGKAVESLKTGIFK